MKKCYLGDSVYAEWDGWNIILTTDNGDGGADGEAIVLEPAVMGELLEYYRRAVREGAK